VVVMIMMMILDRIYLATEAWKYFHKIRPEVGRQRENNV
jgi:hypothetical protein